MSFLRRLLTKARARRTAPAARQSDPPPRPKRIELPTRPLRTVGAELPAIWVDPQLPSHVVDNLRDLPTRVTHGRPGDEPGIYLRSPSYAAAPAAPTSSTWWWVEALDEAAFATVRSNPGEAIIASDETVRTQIERTMPGVVGDVWTADPALLPTVYSRYYPNRPEQFRLGVIGYNLKFMTPIVTGLIRNEGIEALIDEWRVFAATPTAITDQVISDSDVVLCEWCGPNAVYASKLKRPGQRLVVRLHRFELETDHWRQIEADQVDRFVTVGDHYRNLVLERTGWPAEKVVVISNQVDDAQLRRQKLPNARYNIGMLGASSSRKRLDLAFDLIEQLHRHDPRFRLHVKTALPQEEKWVWDDEKERTYFDRELSRLETDPLRDLVTFDSFGPDVADWFRKIGFILSVSDDESFHLAPAEGMAAGSVPVIRNWPGADSVYSPSWVLSTTAEMANRILETVAEDAAWDTATTRAQREAVAGFGFDRIVEQWADLLGRWSGETLQ